MIKLVFTGLMLIIVCSCTHGNISKVPKIKNGHKVFTYQGRAKFSHQLKEADEMMIDHCNKYNKGKPVIHTDKRNNAGHRAHVAIMNGNQVIEFKCLK